MARRRPDQKMVTYEDQRWRAQRTKAPRGNGNYPLEIPPGPLCGERKRPDMSELSSERHKEAEPMNFHARPWNAGLQQCPPMQNVNHSSNRKQHALALRSKRA